MKEKNKTRNACDGYKRQYFVHSSALFSEAVEMITPSKCFYKSLSRPDLVIFTWKEMYICHSETQQKNCDSEFYLFKQSLISHHQQRSHLLLCPQFVFLVLT